MARMSAEIARLERSLGVYRGLVEVSSLINAITDFNELLSSILDVARRVMRAEASSLFLVDAAGDLRLTVARGPMESLEPIDQIVIPRGRGISGWVLANGQPLLVPDAYADPRFYSDVDRRSGFRTRSILCVPLARNGADIGVLQVLNPVGREAFEPDDVEPFAAYATLAATAIDRVRALDRRREQDLLQQELAIAMEIQSSFLPQTLPARGGISFSASYRPARAIGGDFYDVIEMGEDEIYFVIGDVSGKGTPAALLMAQSLSMLRLIIRPGIGAGEALRSWNQMLCGRTIRGMFITALLGRIVLSTRCVELASAGHCSPFLLGGSPRVRDIRIDAAPPLGILLDAAGSEKKIHLEPGELFCAFTDGLTESFNTRDQLLDRSGVSALLDRDFASPAAVVAALLRGEMDHRAEAELSDDLTLVVFGFA